MDLAVQQLRCALRDKRPQHACVLPNVLFYFTSKIKILHIFWRRAVALTWRQKAPRLSSLLFFWPRAMKLSLIFCIILLFAFHYTRAKTFSFTNETLEWFTTLSSGLSPGDNVIFASGNCTKPNALYFPTDYILEMKKNK